VPKMRSLLMRVADRRWKPTSRPSTNRRGAAGFSNVQRNTGVALKSQTCLVGRRLPLAEPIGHLAVEADAKAGFVARRRALLQVPARTAAVDRNERALRISERPVDGVGDERRVGGGRRRAGKEAATASRRAEHGHADSLPVGDWGYRGTGAGSVSPRRRSVACNGQVRPARWPGVFAFEGA
jgi:hypothetical protein